MNTTIESTMQMTELSEHELAAIEGGWFVAAAVAIWVAWECLDNAKSIVEGAQAGWAAATQ